MVTSILDAISSSVNIYKKIFSIHIDPYYILDTGGNFLDANPACEELTGVSLEEILQSNFSYFLAPKELDQGLKLFQKILQGATEKFETTIVRADGTHVIVDVTAAPVIIDNKVVCVYGTLKNITERKEIEQQLRDSEANLSLAEQIAYLGNWVHNVESNSVKWSNEMFALFGLVPNEIQPTDTTILSFVHPEDKVKTLHAIENSLAGSTHDFEYRIVRKDGEIRYIHSLGKILKNDHGQTIRVGTVQDITDRILMQAELRKSEERYRNLVELSPIPIATHRNGIYTYVNQATMHMFGATRASELLGQTCIDFVHPIDRPIVAERINQETFLKMRSEPRAQKLICLDGTMIDAVVSAIPTHHHDGEVQVVFFDISQQKQLEQTLRESEEHYHRLQTSLDMYSKDLFRVMKLNQLEARLVDEIGRILEVVSVKILEIDRVNQTMTCHNGDGPLCYDEFIIDWEDLEQVQYGNLYYKHGLYYMKLWDNLSKTYLLCIKKPNNKQLIKPKQAWLKTIVRYTTVLFDNLRTMEELMQQLEKVVNEEETPTWALKLIFNLAEKERTKLSSDLHDAALQDQINWYRRLHLLRLEAEIPQQLKYNLEQIEEGLLDVIHQIRITCNELRPPLLMELGLIESLDSLFAYTQIHTNYSIQFDHHDFNAHLSEDYLIAVYRIVQELLANAAKHSQATEISFCLSNDESCFYFSYEDNGVGMDIELLADSFQSIGISGIKNRVRSLRGYFICSSKPDQGFQVDITLPLDM